MINAQVICSSINPLTGDTLTTLLVRFHRFILPEVLTHRKFSRNTSSSRAVPVSKRIAMVKEDLAYPVSYGKAAPTMFSTEENSEGVFIEGLGDCFNPDVAWQLAANSAISFAESFAGSKYHKQIVNRIIEPYTWTDMIISSTEWDNFLNLRLAEDAQPEIRELAKCIKAALDVDLPKVLSEGQWHLPFVSDEDKSIYNLEEQKKLSVVRCARVSYKTNKDIGYDANKDIELFNRLKEMKHFSCFEHVAAPDYLSGPYYPCNFDGFVQYRGIIENEK